MITKIGSRRHQTSSSVRALHTGQTTTWRGFAHNDMPLIFVDISFLPETRSGGTGVSIFYLGNV